MVNGFAKFQSGYHQFRFNAGKGDEIDTIAVAFDQMADEVIEHLGKLESEVQRRTESEDQLKDMHGQLEARVKERTKELTLEVAQRQKAEFKVRYLAEHDELTGLLNRRGFYSEINKIIHHDHNKHFKIALMLIDLDRFKQVNDAFGHKIGDKLLIHIAKLLIRSTGVGDLVARLGGDEFAIIMRNHQSLTEVADTAEQILSELNLSVAIDSHTVQSAASIGISIAHCADNTISATQMLQQADRVLPNSN